ncbi:sulfotransferase [Tuberibacillus sp. Marseille-P3662]|uniref:sulfotransferase n=1 Tax=Tuberibacillus sp. Marseille-P3662 TaxID=1965358 RepID=UPI000A1C8F4B|nr:sulfotransferase [Tuberibacillus sp. Marseille-P3662]
MSELKKILYLGVSDLGKSNVEWYYYVFKESFYRFLQDKRINAQINIDLYIIQENYDFDIEKYDLIIIGSGPYFGLNEILNIYHRAANFNIPIVSWCTGFGSTDKIEEQSNELSELLLDLNAVSVRDYKTKNHVVSLVESRNKDIWTLANPLFLSRDSIEIQKNESEDILVNIDQQLDEHTEEQFEIAIQILLNKGYLITLNPLNLKARKYIKFFGEKFTEDRLSIIEETSSLNRLKRLINQSLLTINTDNDVSVLSASVGKPFISICKDDNIKEFADYIGFQKLVHSNEQLHAGLILQNVDDIQSNYCQMLKQIKKVKNSYSFDTIYEEMINILGLKEMCKESRIEINESLAGSIPEHYSGKEESPIFVGGAGRSGTTLLRVMLNAHPNLCSGPELKLLPMISDLYNQTNQLTSIMHSYHLEKSDINDIYATFVSGFFRKFKNWSKADRIIEKTPHNVLIMKELANIFPKAKFIHVVRDGRDVASSLVEMNWRDFQGKPLWYVQNIKNAAKYWAQVVNKAINDSNHPQLRDNVLTIKYEDLINQPEQIIQTVLNFIGEPWSPEVLNYDQVDRGYEPEESSTKQVSKKLYTKSKNRWEKQLSQQDKENFKQIGGQLLVELGYVKTFDW